MINKIKEPFLKAAKIIKPRNTFEWILLIIAVPVPLGVITWVLLKTLNEKARRNNYYIAHEFITDEQNIELNGFVADRNLQPMNMYETSQEAA